MADQRINVEQFNTQFAQISGGTYTQELPTLEAGNTYRLRNFEYTGFTTTTVIKDVNITKDEYPMDDLGFPKAPPNTISKKYFCVPSCRIDIIKITIAIKTMAIVNRLYQYPWIDEKIPNAIPSFQIRVIFKNFEENSSISDEFLLKLIT